MLTLSIVLYNLQILMIQKNSNKIKQLHNEFHLTDAIEIKKFLETTSDGLSSSEVRKRLDIYGLNELNAEKKESPLLLLLAQFNSLLIYVLIASAIISIFLGKTVESISIITIVILAGVVGFMQEFQAGKAIDSLKKMAAPFAKAIRDMQELEVPSNELVPGDIIIINAGDRIPADSRVIESNNLKVDEASLTGES
jgi:Ca2+-transporting ATPase